MYKLIVLTALFAAANAGIIGAPGIVTGAGLGYGGLGLSQVGYGGLGLGLSHGVAVAAAPTVVKTVAPAATSYQNIVQVSRPIGVAVAPVAVKTVAAAPAIAIGHGGLGYGGLGYSQVGYGGLGLGLGGHY